MDLRPGHQQLLQVGGSYLPLLADAMVCMHRSDDHVFGTAAKGSLDSTDVLRFDKARMCIAGPAKPWRVCACTALPRTKS